MMKLSTRGRYGARALMEFAKNYNQGPLSLKEVSSLQEIPLKYLEQIVIVLKDAKLITSFRGPAGGYELSKDPKKIRLLEIIEVLEGSISVVHCVHDPSSCGRVEECAFNDVWRKVTKATSKVLKSVTLADMVKMDTKKKNALAACLRDEMMSEPSSS